MSRKNFLRLAMLFAALVSFAGALDARADTKAELNRDGSRVLKTLLKQNKAARILAEKAIGILVFPSITKAGFMVGGQIGDGVLFKKEKPVGYYNSVAASYGYQVGVQKFGYALFFMNQKSLDYLNQSGGFEVGMGPSIVVVDEGMGKSMTSTTATQDVYAFIFSQKGLMAGMGLQGSKITKLEK
jgi:lipid-binding SYLF domain-containing protein